ncbi:aminopeptidase A-like [Glossina fuscipes fuscipes]
MEQMTMFGAIFKETVPIPTYLVAYSVNNFTYKLSSNYGVKFYTWCRPDIINECEFAAQIAPELYKFFESLLAVPLPFTKMNQLSVPNFGALAMENWGLITYRESSLLFSSNISSEMSRQRLAALVAHELAHQWFGNAVTLKWWSDIRMNEGFATYMSILGVHHLNSIYIVAAKRTIAHNGFLDTKKQRLFLFRAKLRNY